MPAAHTGAWRSAWADRRQAPPSMPAQAPHTRGAVSLGHLRHVVPRAALPASGGRQRPPRPQAAALQQAQPGQGQHSIYKATHTASWADMLQHSSTHSRTRSQDGTSRPSTVCYMPRPQHCRMHSEARASMTTAGHPQACQAHRLQHNSTQSKARASTHAGLEDRPTAHRLALRPSP